MSLDFNSAGALRQKYSEGIKALLEDELRRKEALQPRREYVGASSLGHSCIRSIQFEFAGAPRERERSVALLRKAQFGHLSEAWAYQEFNDAGFHLTQKNGHGDLYKFSQLDGKLQGHPDGVFIYGPKVDGFSYPALWEHKGTGSKTFKGIVADGLRKSKPEYYTQVNLYMAYLELTESPAVFTITNLDSGEQEHIRVEFDADAAQRGSDRAVQVIQATEAGELLPRPFSDPSHFICRTRCNFRERCWGLPK